MTTTNSDNHSNSVSPTTTEVDGFENIEINRNTQNKSSSNILIMRHAERVDSTFHHWIKECFTKEGKYTRNDLNMPLTVPERANIPKCYEADTPITNIGEFQAKLTGEALAAAGINIKRVYCSPAYRCVQTCHGVLTGLGIGDKLPIRIEPGLFEWMLFYLLKHPQFMTDDELSSAGYNIDKTYQPKMSRDDLLKNHSKENCEQFYTRNYEAVQRILEEDQLDGYILIVAHGPSLETCSRQLIGLSPRPACKLAMLMMKISYSSMVHLQKLDSQWTLNGSPVPCVSQSQNKPFDYTILKDT